MTGGGPPRVLVVGEVMTDIIVRPEGPLVMGSDRRADIVTRPGGSGANQAAWLASFGLAVRFAARVAAADHDSFTAQFRRRGVEALLGSDPDRPSGTLVTIVAPDGERRHYRRHFRSPRPGPQGLRGSSLPPATELHP